ncbi:CbrC family protein [Kribbella sp. NPDC049584]|uniref:CbrC family protein n=1 Tax=Kribbella sp. NPDC049584 TaxID=3154833 RepID=UPI00341635CA
MTELPAFRYHPDPLTTGEVKLSDEACLRCEQARGYVYTGPVFAVDEIVDELCPWCIADGSAAAQFEAQFTDAFDAPVDTPQSVITELTTRTPGFSGWQQEHWLYHCGDAAAFLGRAGYADLRGFPDALEMLLRENEEFGWSPEQCESYVQHLDADGEATGYLFRCLHCGTHLAYSDMS